jgi:hypothetical protein
MHLMVLEYNFWKPFQQQNSFGKKFGEEGTKKKIKNLGGGRHLGGARGIWAARELPGGA